MQYETVAEAYRDLEQASGRLALVERLAALLAATPAELLPVVCYLCQGLIAPEFAGVDLGLAEKLAVRAVATATGASPAEVTALVHQTGDLGLAAERLLAATAAERLLAATATAADRPASLSVPAVVDTLRQIAAAEGQGSQGRKLDLLAWTCSPGPPRWRPATCCGWSPRGCGWASARRPSWTRWPRCTPAAGPPGRCWNAPTTSAVTWAGSPPPWPQAAWPRPSRSTCARATRCGPCWPSGCPTPTEILAKLGGECAAEYKYDGVRVQAHRTADGHIELFTRRLESLSEQFPDVVASLAAGLGPREAILEGEVVAYDAATGELHPFQEVMFRRRKHGIDQAVLDVPVGLFCFELLYADGQDLTMLPYPQRRAALAKAITVSDRLRLTTATEVGTPEALDAAFEQAVTDGCEGLVCKSVKPDSIYQAGARGWLWIKLKRDYRTELSDTVDLVVVGAFAGRGRRAGVYGALLLAAYDPAADVFRTVTKCGTGFSDADLAALPGRLAPLAAEQRPARVDARAEPDLWFEPGLVLEILSAELTLSPNYTAAWGQIKPDAGLAMRFPRFTGRWRDDKAPEDATSTQELVDLYRTARKAPAG